jgi:hypothetical protein
VTRPTEAVRGHRGVTDDLVVLQRQDGEVTLALDVVHPLIDDVGLSDIAP